MLTYGAKSRDHDRRASALQIKVPPLALIAARDDIPRISKDGPLPS